MNSSGCVCILAWLVSLLSLPSGIFFPVETRRPAYQLAADPTREPTLTKPPALKRYSIAFPKVCCLGQCLHCCTECFDLLWAVTSPLGSQLSSFKPNLTMPVRNQECNIVYHLWLEDTGFRKQCMCLVPTLWLVSLYLYTRHLEKKSNDTQWCFSAWLDSAWSKIVWPMIMFCAI